MHIIICKHLPYGDKKPRKCLTLFIRFGVSTPTAILQLLYNVLQQYGMFSFQLEDRCEDVTACQQGRLFHRTILVDMESLEWLISSDLTLRIVKKFVSASMM